MAASPGKRGTGRPECRVAVAGRATLTGGEGLDVNRRPLHAGRGCPGPFARFRGSPFYFCSGARGRPHTSFDMFGPAPPAACSIGGTSGSADFSSPRKVKVFSSPSPSVPTTTM